MNRNEVKELFNNEAQELFKTIDEFANQKRLSIHAFEESTKLSRLKKSKKASLDDLRHICISSLIVATYLNKSAKALFDKIEEFERKGTFQTSIK